MCSILGYYKFNNNPIHKDFVQAAFDLMRHRGPDYEQFIAIDERVGLGHQRLAIIDLDAEANQPMRQGPYYINYNGEIYNYIELKEELTNKDRNEYFKTTSDTEVLLKGLIQEGVQFLNRCNGMFAFAFYDMEKKRLILARDRFGVKPLHYMVQDGIFYFSSEIKPLIRIKHAVECNPKIYDSFIRDLATDYDEDTFIKGIYQLKKGSYLICDGNNYDVKQWYFGENFTFDERVFENENDTVDFTERLLADAIAKRLRADVGVCITLSGGLDSATIYTLVKERLRKNIQPFTFRHPGSKTDEYEKVKDLTSFYNDEVRCVSADYSKGYGQIREVLSSLEFPIWNLSAIAYADMYDFIRKNNFIVVLEGHGADEQLGGYPMMVRSAVFEYIRGKRFRKAVKLYKILDETNNREIGAKNSLLRFAGAFVKSIVRNKKLDVSFNETVRDVFDYRILPIVLRAFDRITMRSSVESRSPFLDYRVVEFFKRMPLRYKVSVLGSKTILRLILRKYNKEKIYTDKRKMGFAYDLPAFYRLEENRKYMREQIDKFNLNNYASLKKTALSEIAKKNIGWRDTDAVWKTSSLSIINQMYGISCG